MFQLKHNRLPSPTLPVQTQLLCKSTEALGTAFKNVYMQPPDAQLNVRQAPLRPHIAQLIVRQAPQKLNEAELKLNRSAGATDLHKTKTTFHKHSPHTFTNIQLEPTEKRGSVRQ